MIFGLHVWEGTYRHGAFGSQCAGENVQIAEDGGDGVATVAEELVCGLGVVAEVVWVIEDGGLADGDEVVEEALAGVGKGGVGDRIEGAAESDLVTGEDDELSDADETFSETTF